MPEEKKYLFYSILGVILIMFSVFCVTYNWINNKSNLNHNNTTIIKEKDLTIIYEKGNTIKIGNIKPGENVLKTFKIKNISTGAINFNIMWNYVENNYNEKKNLVYTIACNNIKTKETICPSSGSNIPILKNITIEKDNTYKCDLIIFHKTNGIRKNTNLFKGKIEVLVNEEGNLNEE